MFSQADLSETNNPTFTESWRHSVTTQESFPYHPGLPSVKDEEGQEEKGQTRQKNRKRQEKPEKWNSWSSSSGEF